MQQNKFIMDMTLVEITTLGPMYSLLKLTPSNGAQLPPTEAGQFVQVEIAASKTTFLRRPISVNFVDKEANQLWLLVRKAGEGTRKLAQTEAGETINIILPLGNGFGYKSGTFQRPLLVGGGVGVAPLLYLGHLLKAKGIEPTFLLGAKSEGDLLMLKEFENIGATHISTDDGSRGEKGLVTANSVLNNGFDKIFCCGPMPMMKAVAAIAKEKGIDCEVSLENKMACGLGACLCCVEKNQGGHNVCVCTEGPVFNIKDLQW